MAHVQMIIASWEMLGSAWHKIEVCVCVEQTAGLSYKTSRAKVLASTDAVRVLTSMALSDQ